MHGFAAGPQGAGRPGMPPSLGGEGPGAGVPHKLDEVSKKLDRLIAAVEQLSRSLKK